MSPSAAADLQPLPRGTGSVRTAPRLDRDEHLRLTARVRWLSWLSLGWMTFEGGVAILAGVLAGSVALIGFGIDSAIEGFASVIISG